MGRLFCFTVTRSGAKSSVVDLSNFPKKYPLPWWDGSGEGEKIFNYME